MIRTAASIRSRRSRPAAPDRPAPDLSGRDLAVDGVRVFCVLMVVVAHLLMVGVGVDASGALTISKPVTEQSWFPLATWFGQVMPLFFVLGGFASLTAWRSSQRRGATGADYVRTRVVRLMRPTVPVFAFFSVVIIGALVAGAPASLVAGVAQGVGTPLWFLAAYLLCQWCVPLMARLHERAPVRALVALAASALLVDAVRVATGVEAVGLVNVLFVWFFVQQLGFLYADGVVLRASRGVLAGVAAASLALLGAGVAAGLYSPDMLTNQYPPLFALGLLGIAQLCVLALLHPALTALMRTRAAQALTFAVGSRLMTVYLWHLTCIIAVTGICLLLPLPLPAPGSAAWWATRPLVLAAALVLVAVLSLVLVRFERAPAADPVRTRRPAAWRVQLAVLLAAAPPFLIMCFGLNAALAVFGLVGAVGALLLCRPGRVTAPAPIAQA
ncbi:acyltransferase [Leifsonia sp. 71-9]|uniref:acyltransferase family protein n=1 Tax=Leifsonia sp. 71-9 TaxID=1895934 RepID=UPI000B2DA9B6|nr:acyltransferase [Leifsonia sp. 71-9]